MQLTIATNFPSVAAKLSKLQADIRQRALASAMNKTIALARTQMTREIAAEFNVSAGYVRNRLRVRRASGKSQFNIEAALMGGKSDRRRSANVIAFVEKFVTLAQARKRAKAGDLKQLFVKIKRKGGKKAIKGAFIGNKGRTVFERVGKARLPIKPVQTIDVAQMFNTRRINEAVVRLMLTRFPQQFDSEARFFISRFNQGKI
jgi:hypothetical protein